MAATPACAIPACHDELMPKSISESHAAQEAQSARRALRRTLVHRLVRNGALVAGFILVALGIGATGYHTIDGLPWLDAVLNAAMILTGMGPLAPISTPAAKVFATVYALFSGVFFLTMVAVLLAPALHHFLHRFHLDLRERESRRTDRHE
jgi:hypothetical protein